MNISSQVNAVWVCNAEFHFISCYSSCNWKSTKVVAFGETLCGILMFMSAWFWNEVCFPRDTPN
jgi:hypothetical protein